MLKTAAVRVAATVTGAALLLCAPASAREIIVYGGEQVSSAGIKLYAWGSGKASQNTEKGVTTTNSIEVTSGGLYAGGFLSFQNPVEIADPAAIGRYDYLEFVINFKSLTRLALDSHNKAPTGNGEYRPLPYDFYGNYYDDDPIMVPKARNLRVVLTSADGKSLGHMQAIVNKAGDEEGWFTVAVPLAALGLNEQTGGFALSRLGVSLDFPDTFWIGRIRVITDESPIYVDPMDEQTVGSGDTLVMKAEAEAGITSLVYSWDFNAADGIQEDAVGQLAEMMYKTAGTFTVTLTVRDPDGIKKPVTTKVKIEVT